MWLALSLVRYKWYHSHLVMPCGIVSTVWRGLNEDVKSLRENLKHSGPILGR
jgi:hypothetical protein